MFSGEQPSAFQEGPCSMIPEKSRRNSPAGFANEIRVRGCTATVSLPVQSFLTPSILCSFFFKIRNHVSHSYKIIGRLFPCPCCMTFHRVSSLSCRGGVPTCQAQAGMNEDSSTKTRTVLCLVLTNEGLWENICH